MRKIYTMHKYDQMEKLDFTKWVVTKFYHYTSCAMDVFAEYDPIWGTVPVGDPYLKEIYDHFLLCASAYATYPEVRYTPVLEDNKTTIEIFNINTGEKLYITQYDGRYYLGKDVYSASFAPVTVIGKMNEKK